MERIDEAVQESDYQNLQYFISEAQWDHRALLGEVGRMTSELFSSLPEPVGLLIDETGFPKKGRCSAGVSRQWLGGVGKVDNGQVGVFAALGCGKYVTPIGTRLFLPQEWVDSPERCDKAKVPKQERQHRSKLDLARELIREADCNSVDYDFVAADALYGNSMQFVCELDDQGKVFVGDVHRSKLVYLEDPAPYLPEKKAGSRGRSYTKLRTDATPIKVCSLASELEEGQWQQVRVRESAQGVLKITFYHRQIWLWDPSFDRPRRWHLMIRRDEDHTGKFKHSYTLTNLPEGTGTEKLAQYNCARYWVEHGFRNGKQNAGMKDYQVRLWGAWHHHMAMVMLLMAFMTAQQIELAPSDPILSYRDLKDILNVLLPRKFVTIKEMLKMIRNRQRQRAIDIVNRYRRQGEEPPPEILAIAQG